MKYLSFSFFSIILFSSCCHAERDVCVDKSAPDISFTGFTTEELDTIIMTGYQPGSNFTVVTKAEIIDTTVTTRPPYPDTHETSLMPEEGYEWKIVIPAANRTYRLTEFVYNTQTCKNCVTRTKLKTLQSYKINGQSHTGGRVKVEK